MRRALLSLPLLTLLVLLAADGAVAGTITRVGTLAIARNAASATLLPDGRVLVAGGNPDERRLELFDPHTGTSTLTDATTNLPLIGHSATPLHDGRLLLVGGGYARVGSPTSGNAGTYGTTASEAYDVTLAALFFAGGMITPRMNHAATLLADGRVLISGGLFASVGGFHIAEEVWSSAEIFDPVTSTFRDRGISMSVRRTNHTATLLRDGRVLIAGGRDGVPTFGNTGDLRLLEIFDPQSETFMPGESLQATHTWHTATLLPNGRVLIVGGTDGLEATAEIFDPTTNHVTLAGNISVRGRHTATLLPNGRVLIAGGAADAIVYDPATFAVVDVIPLGGKLDTPAAVLLGDGSVLLVGGRRDGFRQVEVLRYQSTPAVPRRRAVRQ